MENIMQDVIQYAMRLKCIPSFTWFALLIGVLVSDAVPFLRNENLMALLNPKWFKISTIAILVSVIILGNAQLLFHQKELIKYYSNCLNVTHETMKYLFYISNSFLHVIFPTLLIIIIFKQCTISNEETSWWKSFLAAIITGGLYFVMMKLNMVSSYGLKKEIKIKYIKLYLMIVMIVILFISDIHRNLN